MKLSNEGPRHRFEIVDLSRLQYDRNTKRKFESFLQRYEPATAEMLAKKLGRGKNKAFETIMNASAWRKQSYGHKKDRMMSQAVMELLSQKPLPIVDPTPEQLAHGVEGYSQDTNLMDTLYPEAGALSKASRELHPSYAQDTERFRSRMSRITE